MRDIKPIEDSRTNSNFWIFAGLLVILLISTMARDINKPFTGLHSWGHAHGAWQARAHVKYGLGYTKGLPTWAVGDPPTGTPKRYFDHPFLPPLLSAVPMAIFGTHEWVARATKIVTTVFGRYASAKNLLLCQGWS